MNLSIFKHKKCKLPDKSELPIKQLPTSYNIDNLLTYINREIDNWRRISHEPTYSSEYQAYARGRHRAYEDIKEYITWRDVS